jgi:ribose 5-phosphate isomerase B
VYAAQAHDTYSAERARKSNNAQIITMGARVIGPELAKQIVDVWMASEFQGGASARKVGKIATLEQNLSNMSVYSSKEHTPVHSSHEEAHQ